MEATYVVQKDEVRIDYEKIGKNTSIENIEVSKENLIYSSYDGLLVSKDQTILYFCPPSKTIINLPSTLKEVREGAFSYVKEIKEFNHPFLVFSEKDNRLTFNELTLLCPFLRPQELSIDYKKDIINVFLQKLLEGKVQEDVKREWVSYINHIRKRIYKNPRVDLTLILTLLCKEDIIKRDDIKDALYLCDRRNNTVARDLLVNYQKEHFQNEEIHEIKTEQKKESVENFKRTYSFGFRENGTILVTGYKGVEKHCILPYIVGNNYVSHILKYSFSPMGPNLLLEEKMRRNALESIIIENPYIKSLPYSLFEGCAKLEKVTIYGNVEEIGENCFRSCKSLKDISFNSKITRLGELSFAGCESLTFITLPQSLTKIKEGAFSLCKNLEKITIGENVREIGVLCFTNCKKLKSVTIPQLVTTLSSCMFTNCENLEEVILPPSLTSIDSSCFLGCKSLKSINIPKTLKKLSYSAFEGCESLKEITLPLGVETLPPKLFMNCVNLEKITLPKTIKEVDPTTFLGCKNLKYINCTTNIKNEILESLR